MSAVTKPTWVTPHPSEPFVYVALNGAAQVVEVDTDSWTITRRFETEKGPYNLDVSPDGQRLVVTHKGAASIGVFDLESGERLAVLPTTRSVTHGVVITPDGRYAISTAEGVGSEPGAVDFYDLEALEHVTSVDIGKQAGGIAFWKMEEDS